MHKVRSYRRSRFRVLVDDDLEKVLDGFRGVIQQIPPMFSAIHHRGQRLYELARQGIEVERKQRSVEIYALQIKDLSSETISLEICCSQGTYIRTLAADIAQVLGTVAHLQKLVRLASNGFDLEQAVAMDGLEKRTIRELFNNNFKCITEVSRNPSPSPNQ